MYAATTQSMHELNLLAIAVLPAWQARGVGRRLLERVEAVAADSIANDGTAYVRVTVAEDNTRARRLFERSGYEALPGHEGAYPVGQRSLELRKKIG